MDEDIKPWVQGGWVEVEEGIEEMHGEGKNWSALWKKKTSQPQVASNPLSVAVDVPVLYISQE